MSTIVLLAMTGLGLAALYFLIAAGLSLVFGLMDILNFAHGAFVSIGGYTAYELATAIGGTTGLLLGALAGIVAGALVATLVELAIIRPLHGRALERILATVGLGLAIPALIQAIFGANTLTWQLPAWLTGVVDLAGAHVPVDLFVLIVVAALLLLGLHLLLARTRTGLVVRAGVENREMVTALGIDVRPVFTAVFALGGAAAGLAGALYGVFSQEVSPGDGTSLLIFAFVVVVIGGVGSIRGTALAAVAVGLLQQFADYYTASEIGQESVVILLAVVLLARRHRAGAEAGRLA
jgi:branched-chain amino acid transport system permease protein